MAERMAKRFELGPVDLTPPPKESELNLRTSRVQPPDALKAICSTTIHDRAGHRYGKGSRDISRAFRRDYPNPIDVVAFPRDEKEMIRVLEWCDSANIAAVPYGGGSSVVGGVEPPKATLSRSSVDRSDASGQSRRGRQGRRARPGSRRASMVPRSNAQLKPHGLTIRHFPQSFEFSTLGGWIATRSGGHFATLYTHIDDFVESLRVVTPTGSSSRGACPGSGTGQPRTGCSSAPREFSESSQRRGCGCRIVRRFARARRCRFPSIFKAADAVRQISQAGLYPANCRVLDEGEAFNSGAGNGDEAVLVFAFESR